MSKILSMITLIALTTGAMAVTGSDSFAKSHPAGSARSISVQKQKSPAKAGKSAMKPVKAAKKARKNRKRGRKNRPMPHPFPQSIQNG